MSGLFVVSLFGLVGCQVGLFRAGSLDQPLVDQFGALTLVEFELLANPESRREVIGQNIEYAAIASAAWEGGQLRIQLIQYNHELSRLQRPNYREQAWPHPNRCTDFQGGEFLG